MNGVSAGGNNPNQPIPAEFFDAHQRQSRCGWQENNPVWYRYLPERLNNLPQAKCKPFLK